MKPNAPDRGWIGWLCENGHHRPLGRRQIEKFLSDEDFSKSESRCGRCGGTMVPCSGKLIEGELIPWEGYPAAKSRREICLHLASVVGGKWEWKTNASRQRTRRLSGGRIQFLSDLPGSKSGIQYVEYYRKLGIRATLRKAFDSDGSPAHPGTVGVYIQVEEGQC